MAGAKTQGLVRVEHPEDQLAVDELIGLFERLHRKHFPDAPVMFDQRDRDCAAELVFALPPPLLDLAITDLFEHWGDWKSDFALYSATPNLKLANQYKKTLAERAAPAIPTGMLRALASGVGRLALRRAARATGTNDVETCVRYIAGNAFPELIAAPKTVAEALMHAGRKAPRGDLFRATLVLVNEFLATPWSTALAPHG